MQTRSGKAGAHSWLRAAFLTPAFIPGRSRGQHTSPPVLCEPLPVGRAEEPGALGQLLRCRQAEEASEDSIGGAGTAATRLGTWAVL